MGKCMKCGNYMPWDTGLCTACKEAEAKANAKRYEQDKKRQEEQRRRQEEWNAQHGLESITTDKDGNIVSKYRDGRTTVQTPTQVKHGFRRTVIILLVLVLAAFIGIKYRSYSKSESNLLLPFEITQTESGDGSNVIRTALSGSGTSYKIFELTVSPKKEGFTANLFGSSKEFANVSNFTANGKTAYRYYFSGYNFDTGLEGEFYLTEINGKQAVIDNDSGKVYMAGSEFFDEHIEKLKALTPTAVLSPLTEKLSGGEYGINTSYYVLKKDGVSLSCSEDGNRINALDESGEERLSYKVQYYESSMSELPDYSDYEIVN